MKKYYHVTLSSNVESIMEKGSIPQIGDRCLEIGDTEKYVWLVSTFGDAREAIGPWHSKRISGDIEFSILEIEVEDSFPIIVFNEYEMVSSNNIKPDCIKNLGVWIF